jgi:Mannosyltransferase (PIG-V)
MLSPMAYPTKGRAGVNPQQDTVPLTTSRAATRSRVQIGARDSTLTGSLSFPIFVGAIHFLIVQIAASLAFRYGTPTATSAPFNGQIGPEQPMTGFIGDIVSPLRLWDGLWYKLIAERGYGFAEANAAFWPLFPWLMRFGHDITGAAPETIGWVIANLSFFGALILLYQLVSLDFDTKVARRTLWAIALFPTSLFFSAVYTESLFLMLALGALLAARRGNWWLAGIVGALAALTRSYGVLLVIPFAVLFIQQYGTTIRRWFPNIFAVALPALGPAIFGWHLSRTGKFFGLHVTRSGHFFTVHHDKPPGNWRAFIDVQQQWNRTSANPLETFNCAINGCQIWLTQYGKRSLKTIDTRSGQTDWSWISDAIHHPHWSYITSQAFRLKVANSDTLELISTILFLVLAVLGLKLLPLYQSAYLIPGLVIPLFSPSTVHVLMSMPRFGLTLFPIFVVIALLVKDRRLGIPLALASTCLLVIFTIQFAQWYWVS